MAAAVQMGEGVTAFVCSERRSLFGSEFHRVVDHEETE
jgi:hypothetical protein